MASLADKIRQLKGKKIAITGVVDISIYPPRKDFQWYQKITDIGDDYFEVKMVYYDKNRGEGKTVTHSISKLHQIIGTIENYEKI